MLDSENERGYTYVKLKYKSKNRNHLKPVLFQENKMYFRDFSL